MNHQSFTTLKLVSQALALSVVLVCCAADSTDEKFFKCSNTAQECPSRSCLCSTFSPENHRQKQITQENSTQKMTAILVDYWAFCDTQQGVNIAASNCATCSVRKIR